MQDPTPLKQSGGESRLTEKVKELIEHRNETLRQWAQLEEEGQGSFSIMYDLQHRATEFELMLGELGNLVGVECLQSGGK